MWFQFSCVYLHNFYVNTNITRQIFGSNRRPVESTTHLVDFQQSYFSCFLVSESPFNPKSVLSIVSNAASCRGILLHSVNHIVMFRFLGRLDILKNISFFCQKQLNRTYCREKFSQCNSRIRSHYISNLVQRVKHHSWILQQL